MRKMAQRMPQWAEIAVLLLSIHVVRQLPKEQHVKDVLKLQAQNVIHTNKSLKMLPHLGIILNVATL